MIKSYFSITSCTSREEYGLVMVFFYRTLEAFDLGFTLVESQGNNLFTWVGLKCLLTFLTWGNSDLYQFCGLSSIILIIVDMESKMS